MKYEIIVTLRKDHEIDRGMDTNNFGRLIVPSETKGSVVDIMIDENRNVSFLVEFDDIFNRKTGEYKFNYGTDWVSVDKLEEKY